MFYSLSRSSFHSIKNGNELTFADMQMVFVRTIKKMPVQLIYSIFANLKGVFLYLCSCFLDLQWEKNMFSLVSDTDVQLMRWTDNVSVVSMHQKPK